MALGLTVTLVMGLAVGSGAVLPITVTVYDYASVPRQALADARNEVTRIFQTVGVGIVWRAPGNRLTHLPTEDAAEPESRMASPALCVVILSRPTTNPLYSADSDAMGAAPRSSSAPGRLAYVFEDRVEAASEEYGANRGQVLGHAIAHELGHLLLPYLSHSNSGIMRARWGRRDFDDLAKGWFVFTSDQEKVMRTSLAR
jgi:hypothetical protein